MQGQLQSAEMENQRLLNEVRTVQQREFDLSRQISNLNQTNNQLLRQIESAQLMNNRLRNDIIGVIDKNENSERF